MTRTNEAVARAKRKTTEARVQRRMWILVGALLAFFLVSAAKAESTLGILAVLAFGWIASR